MIKALFSGSIRRQGGSSQASLSQQQQGSRPRQPLVQQILHTRYVVNRGDLQLFLEQKFPQESDFAIRTKNGRWIFMVPEKITQDDIRLSWIVKEPHEEASLTLDPPEYVGWRHYPVGAADSNPLTSPTAAYNDQLHELSPKLFSDDIKLRIIDIEKRRELPTKCISTLFETTADVEAVLKQKLGDHLRIRIILLHSANTALPLRLTERLMRKILTRYQVDPGFLPVLFSFGEEPHIAESGSNNITNRKDINGSRKLSYQLRYAEQNQRSVEVPWSIRQMAVYHHHSSFPDFDLFIFINPLDNAPFETQLQSLAKPNANNQILLNTICDDPFRLHMMPCSSYLGNWRWYFRFLGAQFEQKNDEALTLDLKMAAAASLSFDQVQSLRNLHDNVLSLSAFCLGSLNIIKTLESVPEARFTDLYSLHPFSDQLRGYNESLSVLGKRIVNAIDLLAYALDLQNQETAAKINDHMSALTEESTDHSATVKWITLLTLIYLPGSFISSLFGMSFFSVDPLTKRLAVARDFWIFVTTWLSLTFLTFVGYTIMILLQKPRRTDGHGRSDWLRSGISSGPRSH